MTKSIFLSYSRRELGFVDQLADKIQAEGYTLWLDYRVLIPGEPWDQQIAKGLNDSDTALLVVSKSSITSEYVEAEWRHFLKTNKRIILLIFEAVKLPVELEKCEWVDFRGSYRSGLKKLFSRLKEPAQEKSSAPQKWFKAPFIVWVAAFFAVLIALVSIRAIWTFFITWFLFPLPYKIFKRSFNFTQVQTALIALPFSISIKAEFYKFADPSSTPVLVIALILLFILRSAAMQRWFKPEASVPKYIKPVKLNITNPSPVSFYIDHAVEDRVVAEDMTAALRKYGHPQAENIQNAKAVFVLISRYKANTEADPDHQVVFPVMIQFNEKIAQKLSRIQWIDFRPGVRGLDVIAQLLPNPAELLKKLGARPVSSQMVYPAIISAIYYFLVFLTVVVLGSTLDYLAAPDVLNLSAASRSATFIGFGIILLLFGGLAYFIIKDLLARRGIFSSTYSVAAGIGALGILILCQIAVITINQAKLGVVLNDSMGGLPVGLYFFGVLIMAVAVFINRKDARRWFPAKTN